MPILSTFFGIVTRMFYKDHPPPHFHAEYQGQQGKFGFDGIITVGDIRSKTALRLIREWANLHQGELEANRERATAKTPLHGIPPPESTDMSFIPTVIRPTYRGGYQIEIVFHDGLAATVDFARWLNGPVFEPLRDREYSRRFFMDEGTIAWPNGADIAPEALYEEAAAGRPA